MNDVPAGADVWVTVHLDYGLKGTTQNPSTFLKPPVVYGPFQSDIVVKKQSDGSQLPGGTSSSNTELLGRGKKVTLIYGTMKDDDGNALGGVWVRLKQGSNYALAKTTPEGFYLFYDGQNCTGDGLEACSGGWSSSLSFATGTVTATLSVLGDGGSMPASWETAATAFPTGFSSVSGGCTSLDCSFSVAKGSAYQKNWKFS